MKSTIKDATIAVVAAITGKSAPKGLKNHKQVSDPKAYISVANGDIVTEDL